MFSKLFRRRKEEYAESQQHREQVNWSFLGADMHSHFLPGIDDGAKTIEDSLYLLRSMSEMGYTTIVTTPHVMIDYYPNTKQTILSALARVQDAILSEGLNIKLRAAAEYYIDEHFIKLIDTEPLLTVRGKEVLVEFSMLYEPPMLSEVIFKLQSAGYKPIIAHPERYLFFHRDLRRYRELRDRGCLLQMNMLSLTGYYGQNIKKVADELLSKGLYDYCGSDMHHERHAQNLRAMARTKEYDKLIGYPFLNNLLVESNTG